MKITKSQLKRIIKEELENVLSESFSSKSERQQFLSYQRWYHKKMKKRLVSAWLEVLAGSLTEKKFFMLVADEYEKMRKEWGGEKCLASPGCPKRHFKIPWIIKPMEEFIYQLKTHYPKIECFYDDVAHLDRECLEAKKTEDPEDHTVGPMDVAKLGHPNISGREVKDYWRKRKKQAHTARQVSGEEDVEHIKEKPPGGAKTFY